jgi:hypothetical protein
MRPAKKWVAMVGYSSRIRRKSVPKAVPTRSFRSADERLTLIVRFTVRWFY